MLTAVLKAESNVKRRKTIHNQFNSYVKNMTRWPANWKLPLK